MKKIALCLFLLFIPACVSLGAIPPQEIDGYENAKWGMTPQKVMQAVGNNIQLLPENEWTRFQRGTSKLIQKHILILNVPHDILYIFDMTNDALAEVFIQPSPGNLETINSMAYVAISHLLINTYGPLTSRHSDVNHTWGKWEFPKTHIIYYAMFNRGTRKNIYLSYSDAAK